MRNKSSAINICNQNEAIEAITGNTSNADRQVHPRRDARQPRRREAGQVRKRGTEVFWGNGKATTRGHKNSKNAFDAVDLAMRDYDARLLFRSLAALRAMDGAQRAKHSQ